MSVFVRNLVLASLLVLAAAVGVTACSGDDSSGEAPLGPSTPASEGAGFDRPSGSHGLSDD